MAPLPNELLLMFFSEVLEGPPLVSAPSPKKGVSTRIGTYSVFRLNIQMVCREWFNLVANTPCLWRSISMYDAAQAIRKALQSSRGNRLIVDLVHTRKKTENLPKFLTTLISHRSNIETMFVYHEPDHSYGSMLHDFLGCHFPSLSFLKLTLLSKKAPPNVHLFKYGTAHLKHFEWKGRANFDLTDSSQSFQALQYLKIVGDLIDGTWPTSRLLLVALNSCSRLLELHIRSMIAVSPQKNTKKFFPNGVTLHKLVTLTIADSHETFIGDFLACLNLYACQTVVVATKSDIREKISDRLFSEFGRLISSRLQGAPSIKLIFTSNPRRFMLNNTTWSLDHRLSRGAISERETVRCEASQYDKIFAHVDPSVRTSIQDLTLDERQASNMLLYLPAFGRCFPSISSLETGTSPLSVIQDLNRKAQVQNAGEQKFTWIVPMPLISVVKLAVLSSEFFHGAAKALSKAAAHRPEWKRLVLDARGWERSDFEGRVELLRSHATGIHIEVVHLLDHSGLDAANMSFERDQGEAETGNSSLETAEEDSAQVEVVTQTSLLLAAALSADNVQVIENSAAGNANTLEGQTGASNQEHVEDEAHGEVG